MIGTTTCRYCRHVPRKCRGVLLICCFMTAILMIMLVSQISVYLVGIAAHEHVMDDSAIRNAIPNENAVQPAPKDIAETTPMGMANNQTKKAWQDLLTVVGGGDGGDGKLSGIVSYVTCRPLTKLKYLLVMRVPKSASTSLVDVLKKLSERQHFHLHFDPSGAFNWDEKYKVGVANKLLHLSVLKQTMPILYARHFYHVDFTAHAINDFKYMTIIRDPVSRFVSSYLYYHFSSKGYIQAALDPRHRNESVLQCLENGHEGCATNLITKYFCGHKGFCHEGSPQALLVAKENLVRDFAVVGILEELELSYRVFKKVLPTVFGLVDPINAMSHIKNSNEQTLSLTAGVREAIETANSADIELYKFARQLLHQQANGCGLS